jgi:hypothetical protein
VIASICPSQFTFARRIIHLPKSVPGRGFVGFRVLPPVVYASVSDVTRMLASKEASLRESVKRRFHKP